MNTKEKIIQALLAYPYPTEFRAAQIANDAFPESFIQDSEGRQYNPMCATVARILRKIPGVYEDTRRHGYFRYCRT